MPRLRKVLSCGNCGLLNLRAYLRTTYHGVLEVGAESVIKPARQRVEGTRSGFWQSRMSEKDLKICG